MEGFGQHTTFRLKLTKQTWAVFHQRREQGGGEGMMMMGHSVGRGHLPHPAGQGLGWCCCSWPLPCWGLAGREGFGARSNGKGPSLLQSNSCCSSVCLRKTGRDLTTALRLSSLPLPWLFTLLLPFCPLHLLLSPHVFSSWRGCSFPTL